MKKFHLILIATFCIFITSCNNNETITRFPQQTINGYEYIDLGLSVKWAAYNYGAQSHEEEGLNLTYSEALKAAKLWGKAWRVPIKEDFQELINFCTWKWTKQNNVKGYKVTGPNGNSIFIPVKNKKYESYWGNSICYEGMVDALMVSANSNYGMSGGFTKKYNEQKRVRFVTR